MISKIKFLYPNVYAIIVAIAITFWFNGVGLIISKIGKNNISKGVILSLFALTIFYLDDGKLSELYNHSDNQSTRNAAAVVGPAFDYSL